MFSFFFLSAEPTILRTCARVVHLVFSSLLNRINKKKSSIVFLFFFSCVCVCVRVSTAHCTSARRSVSFTYQIKKKIMTIVRDRMCVCFSFSPLSSSWVYKGYGKSQNVKKKKKRRKSARTVYKNKGKRETDVVRFLDETPSLRLFCLVLHFIKLNTYIEREVLMSVCSLLCRACVCVCVIFLFFFFFFFNGTWSELNPGNAARYQEHQ